jgi:hypothetical protein
LTCPPQISFTSDYFLVILWPTQAPDEDKDTMEELMPELVSLVLGHVDSVSLVACRFACATWMRIISAPQEADQEKKNFCEQCA